MRLRTGGMVVTASKLGETLWLSTSRAAGVRVGKLCWNELGTVVAMSLSQVQVGEVDVLVLTNKGELGWCCGERLADVPRGGSKP